MIITKSDLSVPLLSSIHHQSSRILDKLINYLNKIIHPFMPTKHKDTHRGPTSYNHAYHFPLKSTECTHARREKRPAQPNYTHQYEV